MPLYEAWRTRPSPVQPANSARITSSGRSQWASFAAAPAGAGDDAGRQECRWQRSQLPEAIRDLVLDDQRLRNTLCWFAFDC